MQDEPGLHQTRGCTHAGPDELDLAVPCLHDDGRHAVGVGQATTAGLEVGIGWLAAPSGGAATVFGIGDHSGRRRAA